MLRYFKNYKNPVVPFFSFNYQKLPGHGGRGEEVLHNWPHWDYYRFYYHYGYGIRK
jgi:hypothetical protein